MTQALADQAQDVAVIGQLAVLAAQFRQHIAHAAPAIVRLEAGAYPSAGMLAFDAGEAERHLVNLLGDFEALAAGVEVCPLEEEAA